MADRDLQIEVDETTPIARVQSEVGDPIAGAGGERCLRGHPAAPPALTRSPSTPPWGGRSCASATACTARSTTLRPTPELTLAQVAAWDTYAVGRLARLGYPVHQPRWIYNFRNRHGFTDHADDAFARIWEADDLSWEDLSALSDGAAATPATV